MKNNLLIFLADIWLGIVEVVIFICTVSRQETNIGFKKHICRINRSNYKFIDILKCYSKCCYT